MAYSETIYLVQGDTLPQLKLTIRDQNTAAAGAILDPEDETTWAKIDLTSSTVRMKVREIGGTSVKDTLVGNLTDPTNGKSYLFLTATHSTPLVPLRRRSSMRPPTARFKQFTT